MLSSKISNLKNKVNFPEIIKKKKIKNEIICNICNSNKIKANIILKCCKNLICNNCLKNLRNLNCPFCKNIIKITDKKILNEIINNEKIDKEEKNLIDNIILHISSLDLNFKINDFYGKDINFYRNLLENIKKSISECILHIKNLNPKFNPLKHKRRDLQFYQINYHNLFTDIQNYNLKYDY
uniref:RING-type domain-containing protein n=1 Tax=viral metagenome TaxID=1070528 RepID=A0A6C0AEE7_9ZZZZ